MESGVHQRVSLRTFPWCLLLVVVAFGTVTGCRSRQERDERKNAALFDQIVAAERDARHRAWTAPPRPAPPPAVEPRRPEPVAEPPADHCRRWLAKPVALRLEKTPLADVLRTFCAQQGVSPKISESVQGTLSGDFAFQDPGAFLDILCRNGGLIWYYDGQSVYFCRSEEQESAVLRLRNMTAVELRNALISLELWDGRWSWRNDTTKNFLYVSGPPRYTALVKETLEQMEAMYEQDYSMGVFRLKHTMASDQEVEFHKDTVLIPGVASLLRQIVLGLPVGSTEVGSVRTVAQAPRFLKGTGMVPPKLKPPTGGQPPVAQPPAEPERVEEPPVNVRIVSEPRLNAVLIWDARHRMPYYQALIDQLDQPRRLVEIRAAIIDVAVDHSQELGFAWDYRFKAGDVRNEGGANQGPLDNATDFASHVGRGLNFTTIYQHGIDTLMAKARFLEENGDANVLSHPAVLTIDNVQAQIRHTQTFYVKLEGKEEVDLVDVTVGTVLQVTPHVIETESGMRRVQMTVHIEDGTDQSTQTDQVDGVPRIVQSIVDTHAVVGEEQSLIIGGNYTERKVDTETGVPVLKNIPVLGHLAKNTTQSKVKTQRLFILSPRIVSLDSLLATQGAGLEPVFDRTRRVDWAQRAFGDPGGSSDASKEKREQVPPATDGH